MRRVVMVAIVLGAGASLAGGVALLSGGSQAQVADTTTYESALLEERDLVEREDFAGDLTYADEAVLTAATAGTLLGLQPEGATVRRGGRLYTVEGITTHLLYGRHPMWRDLRNGVDAGSDVRQLERNLVALGYDPDGTIDVDDEFGAATTAAVRRWEEDRGITEDGVVARAEIVFAAGPIRIASHQADVGAAVAPGSPITEITSTRRVVAIDLPALRRDIVSPGKRVTIEMPGGGSVAGRVVTVGAVAETSAEDPGAEPTVEVVVEMTGESAGGYDRAPVEVTIATARARSRVAAPVTALLALAEGGFALEVVTAGRRELVAVEVGVHADGWVEVSGAGIGPGTEVVVAG